MGNLPKTIKDYLEYKDRRALHSVVTFLFPFPFSLSLTFLLLLLLFSRGYNKPNKQTNKEKKIVKTQLAAWYHEKKCEKRSIVFFFFFLTKKWKNKNCDDDSLVKNK